MNAKRVFVVMAAAFLMVALGSIAQAGLVNYWKLDEANGAGTATATVGASNGTYAGDLASPVAVAAGTVLGSTTAQDFDGTGDYATFTTQVIPLGAKTIALWAYIDTVDWHPLVDNAGHSEHNGTWIDYAVVSTGDIRFASCRGIDNNFRFYLTKTVTTGAWHYVVGTWDGTTAANAAKLYVDDTAAVQGTAASQETANATYNLAFGRCQLPAYYGYVHNGRLDDVAFWNTALSEGKVRSIYNARNVLPGTYDVQDMDYIFTAYDGKTSVLIDSSVTWNYMASMPAGHAAGNVWDGGGGVYYIQFGDGSGGDGMTSGGSLIPEPAGFGLIGIAVLALRRRRS